jgi:hypothetical protein
LRKCWEEEGCIYRVLIGGNKIWNLLKKKKNPAGTGTGTGLIWCELGGKFLKFENHGYAGAGARARVRGHMGAGAGTRVRGYGYAGTGTTGFFPKNTARPFSNPYPCTRLPAYDTGTRVQTAGTRVRVVPGGF